MVPENYRVADFVADFISDELKVNHVFLVTGAGIMHLTDGLAKNRNLHAVPLHHEQSCSMAADAYAKVNNEFSVSMYSTGPAATNALTGLAGAWQDSVPSLFISGQVKLSESTLAQNLTEGIRQFGVQELNIGPMVESVSKYFVQIQDPLKIRYELEKAVYISKSGRPGPVWVEIPMDIQSSLVDRSSLVGFTPEVRFGSQEDFESMPFEDVCRLLENSLRPVLLVGRGVSISGASTVLQEFASRNKIPIVSTYLGIDGLTTDSNEYVGKVGVKGDRAGNLAMQNADLILAIGTSLHVSVTGYEYKDFGRGAKLVLVDIDPSSHKKSTVAVHGILKSDAKQFLSQLDGITSRKVDAGSSKWLSICADWKSRYPVNIDDYSVGPEINVYKFVSRLSTLAPNQAVFISDAGSAYYAVSQGVQLTKSGHRYVTSGAMATMGFTLPAAIGASFSSGKDTSILAVTGDGSLQQNIQELQVVAQHQLPIKIFVLNNSGYLSIRASQKNYFSSREIGAGPDSGLTFPDTLRVAEAYGISASRVDKLENLDDEILRALNHPGPYILDVITPADQLIIPTVSSSLDAQGIMRSRPLEDMFPFLDREEFASNMLVDPI
jgi:acetolactate synthase I/II/III large subunit